MSWNLRVWVSRIHSREDVRKAGADVVRKTRATRRRHRRNSPVFEERPFCKAPKATRESVRNITRTSDIRDRVIHYADKTAVAASNEFICSSFRQY